MAADPTHELEAFHRFLGEQLADGGSSLTPEECLELWRAQHPTAEQLRDVRDSPYPLSDTTGPSLSCPLYGGRRPGPHPPGPRIGTASRDAPGQSPLTSTFCIHPASGVNVRLKT